MRPEDRVRVLHMIEATESVTTFVSGRQRSDLDSDRMLLFAVVRAIEIVGEAAGGISDETKNSAADVPWSAIVSMRNRLIHAYFDIDRDILWKTATEEVPPLLVSLQRLLAEQ